MSQWNRTTSEQNIPQSESERENNRVIIIGSRKASYAKRVVTSYNICSTAFANLTSIASTVVYQTASYTEQVVTRYTRCSTTLQTVRTVSYCNLLTQ